jgi:pimeloyl-ACP methyl ester carboxylesterase
MHRRGAILIVAVLSATAARGQAVDVGAPPGRLVDIGGRRLHLNCQGSGSPTVIFEAGASAFAIDWALVQPRVARATRACSYDRARYGWSDSSPVAEMPENVVRDLHGLLQAAGERPPYVMVGHSRGGVYVRIFQRRHPDEVAAMVLVDPSHEDNLFTMYEGKAVPIASLTAEQLQRTMPPGDVNVPTRPAQTGLPFDRLPPDLYRVRVELERRLIAGDASRPVPRAIVVASIEGDRAALAELKSTGGTGAPALGDRPLVVLTRGVDATDATRAVHASLARSSSNARHTVVPDAGHEIQLFQPDAVVQAVEDVLESARTKQPLRAR